MKRTINLRGACERERVQCPYFYKDSDWGIIHCEHPKLHRKNGGVARDLDHYSTVTGGWQKQLSDCPLGIITVEEKKP